MIKEKLLEIGINLLGLVINAFSKIISWIYNRLPFEIKPRKPRSKLGIIESSWRNHCWSIGTRKNEEVINIHTHWQLTNTLPYNLTTMNIYLKRPQKVKGSWMVKDVKSNYWGHYPIPKGHTTDFDASFVIDRKHIKDDKSIIKAEIEIIDPINNTHKLKKIEIYPLRTDKVKKKKIKTEDISKIKQNIEKKVVSVLKNEVEQYKVRGRREGRLGSVEWPKSSLEWRSVNDKIQFLFERSSKDQISSEHVSALVNLYKNATKANQAIIIGSLLKRIDKNSEYCNVAYLIVFALFELGFLPKALSACLKNLEGDKAHGFSDVFRMLDILLGFRYEEFDEKMIKEIEGFVYSTKEHPFRIKERINAIRVRRMLLESKKQV